MEETPRSAIIKSKPPASFATSSTFAKLRSFTVKISSENPASCNRCFVFSDSIGSTSKAYKCPFPFKQPSIALVCPPYPNVASSPVCPGCICKESKISFTIIEICIPAGVLPLPITFSMVSLYFSGCSSLYFSSNFFGYFPL